jgi:hypothetical protein
LFALAAALVAVLVLAVLLSRLSSLRGSPDSADVRGAPGASAEANIPVGPLSSTPAGSANTPAPTERQPASPGLAPGTGAGPSVPTGPAAPGGAVGLPGPARPATAGPQATAGPAAPVNPPPDVQAAIADLRSAVRQQIDTGQLDAGAGDDLLSKVDQIAREVSEGDRAAARTYADRMRDKLGKYRDDGALTPAGYQALTARLGALDEALA